MSELQELYQQVILDHNSNPRNFGSLEHANFTAKGHNPLCGDVIELDLQVENDSISEIKFKGHGCAISKAASSVMTTLVKGKTKEEALEQFHSFQKVMMEDGKFDEMSTLAAFEGVKEFPSRIKCAILPWHALRAALEGEEVATTE